MPILDSRQSTTINHGRQDSTRTDTAKNGLLCHLVTPSGPHGHLVTLPLPPYALGSARKATDALPRQSQHIRNMHKGKIAISWKWIWSWRGHVHDSAIAWVFLVCTRTWLYDHSCSTMASNKSFQTYDQFVAQCECQRLRIPRSHSQSWCSRPFVKSEGMMSIVFAHVRLIPWLRHAQQPPFLD